MKKYLSLVLVLMLLLLVCACGGTADSSGGSASTPSNVSKVSTPNDAASTPSDVSEVSTPDNTASVESYITLPDDFDYSKWMVMVNDKLYRGTAEDGPMGDSGAVEGKLVGTVNEGETPTQNGYSNFGVIDGGYTYDDGGKIQVFTPDGCWRFFETAE